MTPAEMLAQAAEADREADAIFDAMNAAAAPDRFGARPIVPRGFEARAEHASDLRRRARTLRADAAEAAQESRPLIIANTPSTAGARALPLPSTPAVEEPEDTVESVASRIINSDSVAPGECRSPSQILGATEDLEATVARILKA